MKNKKRRDVFVEGGISPKFITESIAKHQSKTNIGAHSIFMGQVRADLIEGKTVQGIEYTAYEEMATRIFKQIREAAFEKFDLTCSHIHHSLGFVKQGEICLFIFTSSTHRKEAIEGCHFLVEEIKQKVPIFGKEVCDDNTYTWKENT